MIIPEKVITIKISGITAPSNSTRVINDQQVHDIVRKIRVGMYSGCGVLP